VAALAAANGTPARFVGQVGEDDLGARLIADLAADTQPPLRLVIEMIVAGGASLRRHWNAGVAKQSIASGAWNYGVLQAQSRLPVTSPPPFLIRRTSSHDL